jgi:hypothetical protein
MEMEAARMDYDIDRQVISTWEDPATGQRVRTVIPPERLEAADQMMLQRAGSKAVRR